MSDVIADSQSIRDQDPAIRGADDAMREALHLVTEVRNQQHGSLYGAHARIARYWSVYLGTELDALDVAQLMSLLKLARAQEGDRLFEDHYTDQIGYGGCSAGIANVLRLFREHADQVRAEGTPAGSAPAPHPSSGHRAR